MTLTSEITYIDKIGIMLSDLSPDTPFVLSMKVAPENRDKFIGAVKSYIDRKLGWDEGWEIIFASDWSSLKKIERVTDCGYEMKKFINKNQMKRKFFFLIPAVTCLYFFSEKGRLFVLNF